MTQVRTMAVKVIAKAIGMHGLVVPNFYVYIQKYIKPCLPEITDFLAAAIQACHNMVPSDEVEPLLKVVVNRFINDRSQIEAITVGLNVVREICLRMPSLMSEELLQDLVLYKKSHAKAVSIAARSLISLFREICPSLLSKKDRGRPRDPKARTKAYGEDDVVSCVPGIKLLQADVDSISDCLEEEVSVSDVDSDEPSMSLSHGTNCENEDGSEEGSELSGYNQGDGSDDENEGNSEEFKVFEDCENTDQEDCYDYDLGLDEIDYDNEDGDTEENVLKIREIESSEVNLSNININKDYDNNDGVSNDYHDMKEQENCKNKKRKKEDCDHHVNSTESSLRSLKRLTGVKKTEQFSDKWDGILSNEDFKRIKELKFQVREKLTKEERLKLVRAGREDSGKYQSRTAVKKKKTGGLSNLQKEHKKFMPTAARRAKVARSRQEKKRQNKRSGKQFLGRKAWK